MTFANCVTNHVAHETLFCVVYTQWDVYYYYYIFTNKGETIIYHIVFQSSSRMTVRKIDLSRDVYGSVT